VTKVATKPQPKPVDTSVLGIDGLTDQYRQTVAAALPRGVEPPEEFWRDLETAVACFLSLQENRTRRPAKRELKRWRNIDRLVSELSSELRAIRQQTPWNATDPLWANRVLSALWEAKVRAEAGMIAHETIGGAFRGRTNPHLAYLYGAVCDLWRYHLGQRLAYSRTKNGEPRGPLIRFFAACVGPVLGDAAPTANGVGSIIDRERRRLDH
jgi:hypothetical protein